MSFDLYQMITDRIIAQLEAGTVPWRKPWTCSQGAISRSTGKPYSVLNQLLLPYDGESVVLVFMRSGILMPPDFLKKALI